MGGPPANRPYTPFFFFFSSRRRHTRSKRDWSSDVCSSDLSAAVGRFPNTLPSPAEPLPADCCARRSEERRVGKECRSGGAPEHEKKKIYEPKLTQERGYRQQTLTVAVPG